MVFALLLSQTVDSGEFLRAVQQDCAERCGAACLDLQVDRADPAVEEWLLGHPAVCEDVEYQIRVRFFRTRLIWTHAPTNADAVEQAFREWRRASTPQRGDYTVTTRLP